MGNIGLLKRAVPFFATFALGVFVTSFFVNIGGLGTGYHEHKRWHRDMWEMRIENEQLREENERLRNALESAGAVDRDSEDLIPPSVDQPVLTPPLPPPAVSSHKIHAR
jgi:hypothetical protein